MISELIDTMAYFENGILIAIVIDAVLLLTITATNSRKSFNVLSYIIALLLLIPLTYQMSRMAGAFSISSSASTLERIVDEISPTLSNYVSSITDSEIGWFVFRRVMWSAMFMALAGFGIYATMDTKRDPRGHATPSGVRTGRRYNSTTSRRR